MRKKFIENFFSLTALRVLTLIVPLITFPYLIRVLGSETYGLVMWSWSIINFFILFINFGFNLSVTKYISLEREDKEKLSQIISTTIATKFFLFFVSFILFALLVTFIPKMNSNKELFYITFCLTIGEMLMPIWYFQGIEKMKYTAIITSTIKILFTLLVFLVIKEKDDFLKVPLLYAISSIASALFAYYIILGKDKISLQKPKITDIIYYLKDSVALFFSNSLFVVQNSITVLFIERYIGLSEVAYYDLVQKFINILITPFHILAKVLYPHIAKVKDFILLKKAMFYSTIIALLATLFIYLFKNQIVLLLFGKNANLEIGYLITLFSIGVIFANLASLLGTTLLVVVGRNSKLFLSILYSTSFYILSLFLLVTVQKITLEFIIISIILSYFVDMIIRVYFGKDILWQK